MEIFINEFRTTNEPLLKEQNNLLSELKVRVYELGRVMSDVLVSRHGIKEVTTRGGKMTLETTYGKEVNLDHNRPPGSKPNKQDKPKEVEKEEAQQRKFLKNLKELHINIPVMEDLVQMPKYPKYLKSLLTNKSRLEDACTVTMNERCLAVLLNKVLSKEKDLLSFTIPYQVSNLQIDNALADLGVGRSLMPYTMYEKLGLGEPKPTRMSLELVDRSIQYPRGIVENVLIKFDKFILPIDFIILDMPEDSRIPIILGRPFLSTTRAVIDVFNKKITLRVGDDEVIFDMDQSMKNFPTEDDECYNVNGLNDTIIEKT
ncbi:DNA-directed DNA polymerase [Tanacetum coccineum]